MKGKYKSIWNKKLLFFIVTMHFVWSLSAQTKVDNEYLVDKQVEAYNVRNLELFSSFYAEDIEFYNYPDKLLFKGKKAFTERFTKRFEDAQLKCTVKNKMILGNTLVYEEYIETQSKKYTVLGIYEVENGKIKRLTFIRQ